MQRAEIRRFSRFLVVGGSGTLLDFAVLSALKYFLGIPTLPANLISYSCGIVNNFLLNRFWVYPETRQHSSGAWLRLTRFVLISVIGLLLNNLIVAGLEVPAGLVLHNPNYGYLPAKIVATVLVLLWNFWANRNWTFGDVK